MPLSLFKDLSRPRLVDIVLLLKRHPGLSVTEMSGALRMSYMGVKQHCVYLEKNHYLTTWLRPKTASGGRSRKGGRPEKMYQLTDKILPMFPNVACDLVIDLLNCADELGKPGLAEEMLAAHYQQRLLRYKAKIKGRTLLEKAQSLARLRQSEGCVSSCEFDAQNGLCIVEYHSPIARFCEKFPSVIHLEVQMFGDLLNCSVVRDEKRENNVTRYEFRLKARQPQSA